MQSKLFSQIDQIIGCIPMEQGIVLPTVSRGGLPRKDKSPTRLRIEGMNTGESFAIRTHTRAEADAVRKKLMAASASARKENNGKYSTRLLPNPTGIEVRIWRTA